ncbi:MAG: acyl carrier protein [Muribaculaceae bacterium]|nr:acyl carrier protein [Muribaculaceae bacterium]
MDINEFIENFSDQFDDTDASVFTPETKFKELDEWSSLMALSIIAMVDEEYDVTLKGDDIRNATTIQDLFNTIQANS